MPTFGALTSEERLAALQAAQVVRARRTEICRELREGRRTARSVLADWEALNDPDRKALRTLKVRSFLLALKGIGPKKADQALDDCRIRPTRRLRGIGPVQRARLLTWLEARNVA